MAKEKLEEELVEQEHIFHYNTVRSGISEQKAQYSGFRISTVVRAAIKDHLESAFKVVMSQKGLVGKIQGEVDKPVYITNIKKAAVSHLLTLSMSKMTEDLEETRNFLDQLPRPGLCNRPLPLQPGLQGLHRPLQLCLQLPCQDLHPPHPHGHQVLKHLPGGVIRGPAAAMLLSHGLALKPHFHTRMVDNLDEMISETSDLPPFCLHNRSSIGSPPCGHFSNSSNDPCPEERININNINNMTGGALRGSAAATSARLVQSAGNLAPVWMSAIVILNSKMPSL